MTTAPTEAALAISKESIKALLDGFEPGALLPELESVLNALSTVCTWAVILGPVALLALGLGYLFLSPKEANYYFGYRCYFGMGSVYAWRFTQRLAGFLFTALGGAMAAVMIPAALAFSALAVEELVWKALRCLIWQILLTALAITIINLVTAFKFDRKGNYRRRRRRDRR